MLKHARFGVVLTALITVAAACGGSATPSPVPVTPAPGTPAAVTPATVTPAPASPAAVTPAPATPAAPATPGPTPVAACLDATPSSPAITGLPTDLSGTLNVWEAYGASGSAEFTAFCTMVANVKAASPGLTVNVLDVPFANLFNNFKTQAAAGAGPDVYIAPNDDLPAEARATLLVDQTALLPKLKAAPYNESDTALTADTVDGKLSAIPESMKAVALFYNTSIFATPPKTTDDWKANASKLGWVYGSGGGNYYLWGLFGAFGGTILDSTGTKCNATANTGVADALKWLSDMKAAGMHMYQNDNDAKADFISGKIGGFIDGPWQTGDLKKALGDKLAVAPGPTGPKGAFQPMAAPDGYYVNSSVSTDQQTLATNFALAMLQPANEQIFVDNAGHIPANSAITITDPITKGFFTAIQTGFARPTAAALNNYWTNFGDALAKVIDAGKDPTTAVADACTAMDKANNP